MATVEILEAPPLLQTRLEELADLAVHCGAETFKLDKIVLCSHSGFFTKAFRGKFAASEMPQRPMKIHVQSLAIALCRSQNRL